MSRRIDIELTSTRPDGTWTWRAAGAKQPKGEIDAAMLPGGAKVGDVLRVDTEKYLDGISVVAVVPTKGTRAEPQRIEIVGTRRNEELVTSTLVEKRGRRDSGDRGPRGDRPDRGPRGDRPVGDRPPRGDRPDRPERRGPRPEGAAGGARPPRRERPAAPPAPKPARLRPGRAHRNVVLAELPDAQKPIAEQLLRGGVPAVRQAIEKQNELARADGQPEIKAEALLTFAEQLLPRLRAAEWRDKAEAALAGIEEIDLRDLRTVVVAADASARDEESRGLAQQLRDGLTARVDGEHGKWLAELTELVNDGRTVRALRLSSRPPKAGSPLPAELAERLAAGASAGLSADITHDRWATLVDAVAFSPVRLSVTPAGIPATVSDELKATIERIGSRVPQIATLFGITPEAAPPRRAPAGRARRPGQVTGGPAPRRTPPAPPAPGTPTAPVDTPAVVVETAPVAEAPVETPAETAPVTETPAETPAVVEVEASDDRAQDAVVVEELGEAVDEG